jgi:hypothetical protein
MVVEVRNRASYGGRRGCRQSKTEQPGDSERGCRINKSRCCFHVFISFIIVFRDSPGEVPENFPELEGS